MSKYRADFYHVDFRRRRGPIVFAVIIGAAVAITGFSVGFGLISIALGFVGAGITYSLMGR